MRFDSRNLLIAVMFLFIIALMVLVYKVNKVVIARIPKEISPKVYVMDLTEAVERQNEFCFRLSYNTGWLKHHLDTCLTLIESERGLEPIPIEYPGPGGPRPAERYVFDKPRPFIMPYEKPEPVSDEPRPEKSLRHLECIINLSAVSAAHSMYCAEREIDNFQQRLERIAPDPNNGNKSP